MENLKEYLASARHKGFVRRPRFFELGDYMTYFFSEERCWSERVDEYLTIYTGVESGELVGVKIKGIFRALEARKICEKTTQT